MFHPDAQSLEAMDEKIYQIIYRERLRQEEGLELIASENYTSRAVMEAQGSIMTNKYAEGYPGKRYYGGCQFVDEAENLAIERVRKLFGAEYANVQPHSGSQANMAAFFAGLNPGDKIMGMDLAQGGHLTHGSPVNFSGRLFQAVSYGLDTKTERIDYNQLADLAKKERPRMLIGGASAYPREIDFAAMADIAASIDALFLVDMAHIAGLVAAGVHPSPVPHADMVTSTTHKTLRGPRGGIILARESWGKKLNSHIFPGIQGGPLEHVIAAKAVCFHEALQGNFRQYQEQVIKNAQTLAQTLQSQFIEIVSGGTDNHLVLMKTDSVQMSGKEAEELLQQVHITTNKNMIPNDQRSPFVTSGIRLGTPALTTRGMKEKEMEAVATMIAQALKNPKDEKKLADIRAQVKELCGQFPVYKSLA